MSLRWMRRTEACAASGRQRSTTTGRVRFIGTPLLETSLPRPLIRGGDTARYDLDQQTEFDRLSDDGPGEMVRRHLFGRQDEQPAAAIGAAADPANVNARKPPIEKDSLVSIGIQMSFGLFHRPSGIHDVALPIEDVGNESEDDGVALRD